MTRGSHLGFDDRDESVSLADGSITSQDVGILQNGLVGRGVLADLQDTTPLGELAAVLLVLRATAVQIIQSCNNAVRLIRQRSLFNFFCQTLPWVVHSSSEPKRLTTPLSTLMPG